MRNYLKKDYNMPAEFNKGVTFFRVGAFFTAAIILVLLSYAFLYDPPPLTYVENRSYTVVRTYTVQRSGSTRGSSNKYRYWLTLRDDETGKEHEWYVKEAVLESYTEGKTVSLPVYSVGSTGKRFLSLENNTDAKAAQKEYYEKYPTLEMKVYMYTVGGLIVAALSFLAAGENEIIRAKSHVFLPVEVNELPPKLEKEIIQPNYDEIFDKDGRL